MNFCFFFYTETSRNKITIANMGSVNLNYEKSIHGNK